MLRFGRPLSLLAGLIISVACSRAVHADPIEFDWTGTAGVYSGGTPSSGASNATYLKAVFADAGENQVSLTITANFLNGENAKDLFFNVTPDSLLSSLTWSNFDHVLNVSKSLNSSNAGPVLTFDIQLLSGQGQSGLADQETASVLFSLTGSPPAGTLTAQSFLATNTDNYYAAAHIQNIVGKDDSGWVASGPPTAVPLPSVFWMGTVLFAGLGLVTCVKKRGQAASIW